MSTVWPEGVDGRSKWRSGKRWTEVRLEGWCEGGVGPRPSAAPGLGVDQEESD